MTEITLFWPWTLPCLQKTLIADLYILVMDVMLNWWGSLRERDHWGDPDVDGRIILRWIFRKWEGVWGLDGVGSG
jgi:hypothetical protein